MSQEALIQNALEQIRSVWQVEEKDIRGSGPKGFDWLPGSHLVSVRAVPVDDSDPTYLFLRGMGGLDVQPRQGGIRLSVTTNLLRDFSSGNCGLLNAMAPSVSSTYSIVYPPLSLQDQFSKTESIGPTQVVCDLDFFSSVYLDESLINWLPRFFAQMTIMQPVDAELLGHELPKVLDGGISSFELGYKRQQPNGILHIADQVFIPAGAQKSMWKGSNEFCEFANKFSTSDVCLAFGEPDKFSCEVPFGSDTALIRCWTDQPHPRLGNGLLVTLDLPFFSSDKELWSGPSILNIHEARSWTEVAQFGCWHSQEFNSKRRMVTSHSIFVPNALYREGLVANFILWEIGRARWVRQTFFPEIQDRLISEIYEERFK